MTILEIMLGAALLGTLAYCWILKCDNGSLQLTIDSAVEISRKDNERIQHLNQLCVDEGHVTIDDLPMILNIATKEIRENNIAHQWPKMEQGTMIALIHSELSEWLDALRHGNPPSVHIPEFSGAEEESADSIIRILDLNGIDDMRIGEAMLAKMKFNRGREIRHGNKAF